MCQTTGKRKTESTRNKKHEPSMDDRKAGATTSVEQYRRSVWNTDVVAPAFLSSMLGSCFLLRVDSVLRLPVVWHIVPRLLLFLAVASPRMVYSRGTSITCSKRWFTRVARWLTRVARPLRVPNSSTILFGACFFTLRRYDLRPICHCRRRTHSAPWPRACLDSISTSCSGFLRNVGGSFARYGATTKPTTAYLLIGSDCSASRRMLVTIAAFGHTRGVLT
jgi:hypothetical protein